MASTLSTYGANQALAFLMTNAKGLYLAAHEDDPSLVVNPAETEVQEGDYARQPVRFTAASARTVRTSIGQRFVMPQAAVRFLAVWTSLGGGFYLVSVDLGRTLSSDDDGVLIVPPGDLAVSL